jgi:hypothetical protein
MSRTTNRSFVLLAHTIAALCLVILALGAHAQYTPLPNHLAGTISEYSPSNLTGGPWEVRGKWTLDVHGSFANFSAAVTMETSDYGVTTGSIKNPTITMDRNPHTHHITLTNALVTVTSTPTGCPTYNAPQPSTSGPVIVITGPVSVTANGQPAPFEAKGPSSLQICIAGGAVKPWTNFGMVFSGEATSHFGSQFYNGVVVPEHQLP